MGSGIRNLGNKILQDSSYPKNIHIFLSHFHWDHIMGFLLFTPFYDDSFTFNIYGFNKHTPTENFSKKILDPTFWPVSIDMLNAKINFIDLDGSPVNINSKTSVNYTNHTHPNTATTYKATINGYSVVYTTDCEHPSDDLNKNVVSIAKDADVLIHDSHFTRSDLKNSKGWGHSSWGKSVDVAKSANVKQLFLFHYNPHYNDEKIKNIELKAKKEFQNTIASKQGLKINF
jgi:phosphoribosyl 1,2-cyclic phosphodiesterase